MKFLKLCAGLGLAVLASVSVNASAQTAACKWTGVYGYGGGGASYTVLACKTPTNTVVASRTDVYNYQYSGRYTCGTPSVAAGYRNTGIYEGSSSYPTMCNTIITAEALPQPPKTETVVVYPGSSCSWAHRGNYQGYDVYDFNCNGYGKVAVKTLGYPWSYSSSGYSCGIAPVSPYKVESSSGTQSCDVTKVTLTKQI